MKGVRKSRRQETRQPRRPRYCLNLLATISCLLIVFATSCAKQGYPSGGPKDETPPVALSTRPANGSLNFDGNQFYIEFDEYVVLKDATNNVLVSPPLKNKPEYTTKGKGVLVKLNDTLLPDATYLFQFKEAIADFNEGNLLPSFEYVFSTGATIDTLMMGGRVIDARSGKAWKETVTVVAYDTTASDTAAFDGTPRFATRCDKSGYFAFHNLPSGNFRIVAFEDKNLNLRLDNNEPVAWLDSSLTTVDSIDTNFSAPLRISTPINRQQRLLKAEFTEKGRISIVTQAPMEQPEVTGEAVVSHLNLGRDTLTLWCLNPNCDSTWLVLRDNGLDDTLRLRYRPVKQKKGRHGQNTPTPPEQPLMRPLCSGNSAFYDDLRLAFRTPIVQMADSAQAEITNIKDSSLIHCPLLLDSSGLQARFATSLHSGTEYRIRLRNGLFTDLYGNTTDSLTFTLTPRDYGTLTLHIDNRTGSALVIEVLDKRDTVIQHALLPATGSELRFSHLTAGDYRLRAVIDRNGDGCWTPGDYRTQRQPEESVLFEKTLQLREKWEMEERWTVGKPASTHINASPLQFPGLRKGKIGKPEDFK